MPSGIVRYLEILYRKMHEAGASALQLDFGPQERIILKKKVKDGLSLNLEKPFFTTITAPLSGVFYRAVSPSAPAFAEVGQKIATGDILCIIEAMKVMNEIKATVSGRVVEIRALNGKHVKKGDVLFVVDKEVQDHASRT